MGMSTHVEGVRVPDEKWEQMKEVWDACSKSGVEIPEEVKKYFDYIPPEGVVMFLGVNNGVHAWTDGDMRSGFQIEIAKLPANIKYVRVYNSW
ncbi:MAG: hypothetical protein GY718_10490 [Lentisphaerae bacterium]|nr:hypothetical protein [Lentisphaerota bacterium]